MRQRIVTSHYVLKPNQARHSGLASAKPSLRNGCMPSLFVVGVSLFAMAQAESVAMFSVGGYTGARLSDTENTDARLSTDLGLTGSAGYSWQSGNRSLNSGYSISTRATAGSWLDLENAEGRLDQQITGATRFTQQARNNLWDVSFGHQASLYNPSDGLTINPFDLDVQQGFSANAGLNLQPGTRTRLRLGVNAGTSVDADFENQGHTLGWTASATRQLNPRTSGSIEVSQTDVYSPGEDEPVSINNAQLSLSRVLQNGSVSGSLGFSQSEVEGVNYESVTGSLARRWLWSEHEGELSYNRAISNTLLDLTTLEPLASSLGDQQGNSSNEPEGDTFQSLSLSDSVRLELSTERWCDLCTNSLSISGTRTEQLSSVPGLAEEQYIASVGTGMAVKVNPNETVSLNYLWQGQGLGPEEEFQGHTQVSGGWQRALDRRLTVSGSAQVQRLTGRGIDARGEWSLRAEATYQLGSVQ